MKKKSGFLFQGEFSMVGVWGVNYGGGGGEELPEPLV